MKTSSRVRMLTVIISLTLACVLAIILIITRPSSMDLLEHCKNINQGNNVPYPDGCMQPIDFYDGIFIFINTNGEIETYIVITKRDGTFLYYSINHS